MTSALYGRIAVGRCVTEEQGHVGCVTDVIGVADRVCSGRRSCDIKVTNPAMDALMTCNAALRVYLEASYRCVTGAHLTRFLYSTRIYFVCSSNYLPFVTLINTNTRHTGVETYVSARTF